MSAIKDIEFDYGLGKLSREKREKEPVMMVEPGTAPEFNTYKYEEPFAVQTLDGGKTWTGVNGRQASTHLKGGEIGFPCVVDSLGGIIYFNEKGCSADPGPRHRVSKWSFMGTKGWAYNEKDYVLEEESRHCTHGASFARAPSGRIWAAVRVEGRWTPNGNAVHVRFSDTDGKHWHTWKHGRTGRVPGAWGTGRFRYRIVPYRGQAALFWTTLGEKKVTSWSRFDGKSWTPPENLGRELGAVVTLGKGRMFAEAGGGILEFKDGTWIQRLKRGGVLCRSGEDLMLFQKPSKKGTAFEVIQMDANGQWGEPRRIEAGGEIARFLVQRYCPPNLGAVAVQLKGERNRIKIIMVPNMNWKG